MSLMKLALLYTLSTLIVSFAASNNTVEFIYNGFSSSSRNNLSLDGLAHYTDNGLLQLTNNTISQMGHALYIHPINFKKTSSFSTVFAFSMVPLFATKGGHGMAFVISPTKELKKVGASGPMMGLMNDSSNGNSSNHIFAVEFDAISSRKFNDPSYDHVGIDINNMTSEEVKPVGYVDVNGAHQNLTLLSDQVLMAWIDYDGSAKRIDVTLAPLGLAHKPSTPLMTLSLDITSVLAAESYVGFSASTGAELTSNFYVVGWSFKTNGRAPDLDLFKLPKVPRVGRRRTPIFYTSGLPILCLVLLVLLGLLVVYVVRRRRKFAEVLEDWEREYGPQRFRFKDLYKATKGFKESELLGKGGFGSVYKGVLPETQLEIAVKRVSHDSRQGIKEFVAEVVSIGRLRHRNLVRFLGYCRRKGELFLVYENMPNGSLDKYLYNRPRNTLNWSRRFAVIKGVASGLLYLHEEWEQVVIHRDIKASNILLDSEFNGKIGDFGLARLYDHGTDPHTTHIVGTLGYLAPEHTRTGKATTSSDVYAYGAFLLEVATGKRPIQPIKQSCDDENFILVDWVFSCWTKGNILQAMDRNLGMEYEKDEAELVLKLGLMCSHPESRCRPSIRQVVQYLGGDCQLPELSSMGLSGSGGGITYARSEGFDSFVMSEKSSVVSESISGCTSISATLLSGGR